jgi:hypothetical protein
MNCLVDLDLKLFFHIIFIIIVASIECELNKKRRRKEFILAVLFFVLIFYSFFFSIFNFIAINMNAMNKAYKFSSCFGSVLVYFFMLALVTGDANFKATNKFDLLSFYDDSNDTAHSKLSKFC